MLLSAQVTKLFELSRHKAVPVADCNPARIMVESASVLKVMSLVESGEKVEAPLAVKLCPVAMVAPALKVASPVVVKALFTVEVPPVAPKDNVVAAFPIFKVVALVLNREAVVEVVVKSPPLTATSPAVVMFPEAPVKLKLVAVMSLAPKAKAFTISASDRSKALVIVPDSDCTLMPEISASSVSRFSTNNNCDGAPVLVPSARPRYV